MNFLIQVVDINEPNGWLVIPLKDINEKLVRTFMLQIAVLQNHQQVCFISLGRFVDILQNVYPGVFFLEVLIWILFHRIQARIRLTFFLI